MPTKYEHIPIAGTKYDKRMKLTPEAKEAVKILSERGYSQRQLAILFRCSRRLIQHILHPEKRKPDKPRSKEYWTTAKQRYRQRKRQLFEQGKIVERRRKIPKT